MIILNIFLLGRSFLLQLPDIQPAERCGPLPLVFVFHGHGGTGQGLQSYFEFSGQAIFVYPDAVNGAWNAGFCCETSVGQVDDVGFVEAMIEYISDRYMVDQDRIYAVGSSNGGMLCHRLAGELSHRFAAIVDVSGAVGSSHWFPYGQTEPVSILMIHGVNDDVVPYAGDLRYLSFDQGVEFWKGQFRYTVEADHGSAGLFFWTTWSAVAKEALPYKRDRIAPRELMAVTYFGPGHHVDDSDKHQLRTMILEFLDGHPKK